MKYLKIIMITVAFGLSYNVLGQNLDAKLLDLNFLNKDCLDLNKFYKQLEENKAILQSFSNEEEKNNREFYIYISHFYISSYDSRAKKSFKVFFFTKDFKLINGYVVESDLALKVVDKPVLLKKDSDFNNKEIDYMKSMLQYFKTKEFNRIEKEQNSKKGLICSCYSYESIYNVKSYMEVDVYFFDLFYKKVANNEFD